MTYSVVAHDPVSGSHGVAVQSHWFNVGRLVPWVRFGVGVVATQATTEVSYGWRGLDMMAEGVDAVSALRILVDQDADAALRQVAIVDGAGGVAVHTGKGCLREASHISGDGWSVQGNLLASGSVVPAMADAYAETSGTMAERMLSTLEAAEAAGGDLRGSQSAALVIGAGPEDTTTGYEAGVHIGVADHPAPVAELRRLFEMDEARRALREGQRAITEGDMEKAARRLEVAGRVRDDVEGAFWRALALARLDRWDEALETLAEVVTHDQMFNELLMRVAERDETARRLRSRFL